MLTRRYQTMGFRVDDPWERELPTERVLTTYDPVAGRLVNLNGASSAQRAAHAAWVAERDAAFSKIFPDTLSRLTVRTDQERLDALIRFFPRPHARGAPPLAAKPAKSKRQMSKRQINLRKTGPNSKFDFGTLFGVWPLAFEVFPR